MSDPVARGQLHALATALEVDPARIDYLGRLDVDDVYALRSAVSAAMFDSLEPVFVRLSKLAPLVPDALAASLAEKIVPPVVSGMAAGALGKDHPKRIPNILMRISPRYLADAAPFLDPRVIPTLAPVLGLEVLLPAARELLRRRDFLTAAGFVEHSPSALIAGLATGIDDDEGLLHTAALIPFRVRLNDILRCFPEGRVQQVIAAAAVGSGECLVSAVSVLRRLDDDLAAEYGHTFFASLDEPGLARLLVVARAEGVVGDVVDIAVQLGPDTTARIADSDLLEPEREQLRALAPAE